MKCSRRCRCTIFRNVSSIAMGMLMALGQWAGPPLKYRYSYWTERCESLCRQSLSPEEESYWLLQTHTLFLLIFWAFYRDVWTTTKLPWNLQMSPVLRINPDTWDSFPHRSSSNISGQCSHFYWFIFLHELHELAPTLAQAFMVTRWWILWAVVPVPSSASHSH